MSRQPLIVENLPSQDLDCHIKVYANDGFYLPWHMHDSYELTLIQKGSGQRIVGSHIAEFGPGDMVLLAPGLPHAWKDSRRVQLGGVRAITLKLAAQHPLLGLLQLPEMDTLKRVLLASRMGLLIEGGLRDLVACKLEELCSQPEYRQFAGILDILACVGESQETRTLMAVASPDYQSRESGSTRKLIDYIFDNLAEPLAAETLAEIAGVHPASLGRLFKRTTGVTLTEFINQVRINRASQLLQSTELQMLEISLQCGYQNLSWFNRMFKQQRGCTPREYRARLTLAQS